MTTNSYRPAPTCRRLALLASCLGAAWTAMSAPALAQDQGREAGSETDAAAPKTTATDRPIEEIIVTGDFISQRAIARKRYAPNFRDVVDQSEIERLPDQDLAEALDRVPGISVQESSSRGFRSQFISVNGISPDLNNVTILGQEITSTTGDRAIALDLLPAGAASVIEVHKSFSPELEGNFIGGQINIIPLSAFEYDGPHLKASFEGATFNKKNAKDDPEFQPISFKPPVNANLQASTRFGPDGKFGIATALNFFRDSQPEELAECDSWRFAASDVSSLPEDLEICEGMRLENGVRNIKRYSALGTLEYRPSEDTRFFATGIYTETEEDSVSLQTEWNFFDAFPNAAAPRQVQLLAPGVIFNPRGENEKELDVDRQKEKFYFGAAGFSTKIDRLSVNGSISYNEADSRAFVREWSFDSINFASTIDFNERFPFGVPEDPAAFNDPTSFLFDEIDVEPTRIDTNTVQAALSVRYDASVGGHDAFLETGIKGRLRESVQNADEFQFDETPGGLLDGATLADFGLNAPGLTAFGLELGPAISPVAIERFVAENPDTLELNEGASFAASVAEDFSVDEDVFAGYVSGGITIGNLEARAGLRVEHTQVDATVKNINEVAGIITEETASNEFTDLFPSAILRYDLAENFVLRASFSQTIARARLNQLAGTRDINFDNADVLAPGLIREGGIAEGNPELKPFKSDNFDLGVEFYPDNNGFLALSAFYKNISNPIFIRTTTVNDFAAGGFVFEQATVTRPENAGNANLYGLLLAGGYQLRFLPGWLSGFGLNGNVTLIDSELKNAPGRPGAEFALPGQADLIVSVTPYYRYGGLELSVVWNFTGNQLAEIRDAIPEQGLAGAGNGVFDIFQDSRATLDIRASYTFLDRYTLYVSAENLTEESRSFFQGRPENQAQIAKESATFWFGLRAVF